tara:strand:+ start:721 stop:909 length:189 start_codon:yes stop_codon:yes gene_type:complete
MRIKTSRKDRTCKGCGQAISKGQKYGQKTKTITDNEAPPSDGMTIYVTKLSFTLDYCQSCIT